MYPQQMACLAMRMLLVLMVLRSRKVRSICCYYFMCGGLLLLYLNTIFVYQMQSYDPNDIVYVDNIGMCQLVNCGRYKTLKLPKKHQQPKLQQLPVIRKQKQSLCFDPESFRLQYEQAPTELVPFIKKQITTQTSSEDTSINIVCAKLLRTNVMVYAPDTLLCKEIKVKIKIFIGKNQQHQILIPVNSSILQLKNKALQCTGQPLTNFDNVRLISINGGLIEYSNNKQTINNTKITEGSRLLLIASVGFTFDVHFKSELLKLSNNSKTLFRVNNDGNNNYQICLGSTVYHSGKYYFQTKIQKFAEEEDITVGIAHKSISFNAQNIQKQPFWGYMPTAAKKIGQDRQIQIIKDYGPYCKVNDIVGTLVHFINGLASVSFYVNNKFIGKAFSSIPGPVYPAFVLGTSNIQISINTSAEIPFDLSSPM